MSENDVRDELEFHVRMLAEENMRKGMSAEEARRAALDAFGALNTIEEQCRENRRGAALESFLADAKHGLRLVRRTPSFSFTVIATLAIAIAACATMFSVVDAVLLQPIGYPAPEKLLAIFESWREGQQHGAFSAPNFLDVQQQSRTLSSVAAFYTTSWNLAGRETEAIRGIAATQDLFRVLGVPPAYGRSFADGERNVVVISYALATRQFGDAAAAVNRALILDGKPRTVIGVMPRGFRFPNDETQVWTSANFGADVNSQRGAHYLGVLGRVAPNATAEQASRELAVIGARLTKAYPDTNDGETFIAERLDAARVRDVRRGLLILLAAVIVLAIIAAANLANLLLTRVAARAREWAVRNSLGASRFRVMRQFLTESLVLGILGGACALLLTAAGLRLLTRFGPDDIPRIAEASMNGRVVLLTIAASLLMSVFFGLVPALAVSPDRPISGSPAATRFRALMVMTQLALAVTLLCGASLLIRSFLHVLHVDPGFDPRNVLTFEVSLPSTYDGIARVNAFHDALLERLRATPGIEVAGVISQLPLSGGRFGSSFRINGIEKDEWHASVYVADEGYFRAMRIPFVRGRRFDGHERANGERVLLVSSSAAKKFWPDSDPIGAQIRFGASGGYERYEGRIIGIVADVHQQGQEEEIEPTFYVPLRQAGLDFATYVVRSQSDPQALISAVRAVDPNIVAAHINTMDQQLADSLARRRFQLFLLTFFAGAALLLAALGVYGVIAYSVTQRTKEIGIRVALGSSVAGVFRMVLGDAVRMILPAIVAGIAAAAALRSITAALLFRVSPTDPSSLTSVAIVVAAVSLLAACIPAKRAASIDPTVAMRFE